MISKNKIKLLTIWGINISLDYSWIWIFLLITFSFSVSLLPALVPGLENINYLIWGLVGSILFFISVVTHELAHTLVARSYDLPVNKITLFLFGGVSELESEPTSARTEFAMALAGPLMSLAIGGLLLGIGEVILVYINQNNIFGLMLQSIGILNLFLAFFNLLPGFPLDGGRVLRSLIWSKSKNFLKATSISVIIGKIIAVLLIIFAVFQIIIGNLIGGLWLVFIGFFLFNAANWSYLQTKILSLLAKRKASEFKDALTVVDEKTLADTLSIGQRYLVKKNDQIYGLTKRIFDPEGKSAGDLAVPISNFPQIEETEAASKLATLLFRGNEFVVLIKNGDITGIATIYHLIEYLQSQNKS